MWLAAANTQKNTQTKGNKTHKQNETKHVTYHANETKKKRLQQGSLATDKKETKPVHSSFAWKPRIVDRYPSTDYPDTPLLPWVARASMPRGVRARTLPPAPKLFTFTGWNTDGSKLYGAVLEVYEKINVKVKNK